MSLSIVDPQLPGLSSINNAALQRITGSDSVELLRFRYRPGRRAVLHVKTQSADSKFKTEGVIWFFAGGKARRLSRKLSSEATFDEATGALYESFPSDHRLPELQSFMSLSPDVLHELLGDEMIGSPILLRYRPGISCTFSCARRDGKKVFVKIIAKEDIAAIHSLNQHLVRILGNKDVAVARSISTHAPLRAIAYEEAKGIPLLDIVTHCSATQMSTDIRRVAMALERLSCVPGIDTRELGRVELMARSNSALKMIAISDKEAGSMAAKLVDRMAKRSFEPRRQLIHGDMKLDHAFLDANCVTFIDTESLSLGDPDYDIAKLEARLVAANLMEMLPADNLNAARIVLGHYASSNFSWYLDAATLQTAKFFAQRPSAENVRLCRAMLNGAL